MNFFFAYSYYISNRIVNWNLENRNYSMLGFNLDYNRVLFEIRHDCNEVTSLIRTRWRMNLRVKAIFYKSYFFNFP